MLTAEQFWIAVLAGEPEVVTFDSLDSLVKDSSAVVLGSVASVTKGPDYLTKEGISTVYQASVHVRIDRVLSGSVISPTPGQVTFVKAIGVEKDAATYPYEDVFAQLANSMPNEQVILSLVNLEDWARMVGGPTDVPGIDPNLYLLLGGQSLLRNVAGLTEPGPIPGWQQDLRGRPFGETIAQVESAAP